MFARLRRCVALIAASGLVVMACGDGNDTGAEAAGASDVLPTVVVTTNILGDVVEAFAGDQVDVVVVMPVGADPHEFQASARQANEMRGAAAMIVNGAGFEQGLVDVIDGAAADGTPTYEAIAAVETIAFGKGHAEHGGDDDHGHDEDHGHEHEGADPHFFTDPVRMARAVDGIAEFLIDNVEAVDGAALRASADAYIAELEALDADVEAVLADLSEDQRVLVTSHEVFGYFADRYGFEVVGTVIPSGSTADGADAGALAALARLIEDEGVPAIFADTSSTDGLADTLAAEVGGDVEVVELFTESLGDAGSGGATYIEMVRTNAQRIAAALAA